MKTVNEGPEGNEPRLRLRADNVQWREVDGEVIALDQQASLYLAGNPTATLLWRALAAGATRGDLISILAETFGIDTVRAGEDVDAFLADLKSRDLLTE
jgi:hypothetical protein